MAGVDITGGGGAAIVLQKDIYVNTSLVGAYDTTEDVNVFLEDTSGNPITPTSSVLVGNDLTITANIPTPSDVLFKFPNPSQYISYRTGDTGWRFQNGWYDITQPNYPAKKAELDVNAGASMWFTLKNALTVNGVASTSRFVDINGVQTFSLVGNANAVVIDKLTGLMFTRLIGGGIQWSTAIDNALAYSIILNSITYSDWYLIGMAECMNILGNFTTNGTLTDPSSGVLLINLPTGNPNVHTADSRTDSSFFDYQFVSTATGGYYLTTNKTSTANSVTIYIHDARSLIS